MIQRGCSPDHEFAMNSFSHRLVYNAQFNNKNYIQKISNFYYVIQSFLILINELRLTMFNADKPIESFEDDTLGRSGFARQLANAILQFELTENFAIGLYGEWGCGKTSILNLALKHIEEKSKDIQKNKKPIVLKFNPWNFTDCNQLINQFFVALSNKLKIDNASEKHKAVGNAIVKYSSALEYTEYIPIVGNYFKLLPKLFKEIGSKMRPFQISCKPPKWCKI